MGTLCKIHPINGCDNINKILIGQRKGYTAILRDAANALALCGVRPCGMSAFEKLRTCLMIRLNTVNGKDTSHTIGYLITAVTHSWIDGAKARNQFQMANEESKALLERLLRYQEAECRKLKEFL